MKLITNAPKGTADVLPSESYKRRFVENVMKNQAELFGFKEIRTPVFEHTELFLRSVGETTDVVQKEMYTFCDKGARSITLKPEGTAGALRAILQHGVYNNGLPVKVNYLTSCYRYEKPQTGRLREFSQFGVEVVGTRDPACDAEVILFANSVFERLGIENLSLEINCIGCPDCREKYYRSLKKYFSAFKDKLCETCLARLERNPMRILDCKSEVCSEIVKDAPSILDYICDDCKEHFNSVKKFLDSQNIQYKINPKIVRGLDYYTKTVFEFVSKNIGAQGTVCAGGRYDGLIEELSGISMPAVGLAFGIERVMLLIESLKIEIAERRCDVYIASVGEKAKIKALQLASKIRELSMVAECDVCGRGLRAQMKYADKIGAKFNLVIGDSEIEKGVASIKEMSSGKNFEVKIGDDFINELTRVSLECMSSSL